MLFLNGVNLKKEIVSLLYLYSYRVSALWLGVYTAKANYIGDPKMQNDFGVFYY